MSSYRCIRCGYETNRKYNMNLHLKKKCICYPTFSEDDLTLMSSKNEIFNVCNYCGKDYKHYNNKTEHEMDCVNLKKHLELENRINNVNEKVKEIDDISKEIKELKKMSRKNNVFNVNVAQLNFQLRDYDNPSTSHLTKDLIINNLDEPESIKQIIFENIYYNDDVPENHSLLIVRTNGKQFLIFGHKKNRMIELSETEINEFINNNFCNRYGGIIKRLIGHSYTDLTEEDKKHIDEKTYYNICSVSNKLDIKTDILLAISNLENNDKSGLTLNEFYKQDKIMVPLKAQKYLKYTPQYEV